MIVYLVKNMRNGKRYIGQTSRSIEQRWNEHKSDAKQGVSCYLYNAIRKYGAAAFRRDVLHVCSDKREMDHWEHRFIELFNTTDDRYGYNLTLGGDGTIGYRHSESAISKMRGPRKPLSEEQRRVISAFQKGRPKKANRKNKPWSAERRAKVVAAWTEEKRKQFASQLSGEGNPFYGKRHSDATRARLSMVRTKSV